MSQNIEDNRTRWPKTDFWEFPSDYDSGGKYHKVHTTTYRSGHAVEFDDTEGGERIRVAHAKGSYQEMQHDGSVVNRANNHLQNISVGDNRTRVGGDLSTLADGEGDIRFSKGLRLEAKNAAYFNFPGGLRIDAPWVRINGQVLVHNEKNVGFDHKHEDAGGIGLSGPPTAGSSAGAGTTVVGAASPEFSGNPTAPTPEAGDNSNTLATTAFVNNATSELSSSIDVLANNLSSNAASIIAVGNDVSTVSGDLSSNVTSINSNISDLSGNISSLSSTVNTKATTGKAIAMSIVFGG